MDSVIAKPPNRARGVPIRRESSVVGKRMTAISAPPVNPDHGPRDLYPDVSGVSDDPNRLAEWIGEKGWHQVCFAEAIQTVVGSDPDISFAILKNGVNNIVTQSIPGGE